MVLTYPLFVVALVAFCGVSYLKVVKSRNDQVPTEGDFLAALLPLLCIPAFLSLGCGFYKWLVNSYRFLLTESLVSSSTMFLKNGIY